MWNDSSLKSLNNLPSKLSVENLKNIQRVIDIDKYKSSMMIGRDLCGCYAPFCENCDKSLFYPCAVAYVKMKQTQGGDFVILNALDDAEMENTELQPDETAEKASTDESLTTEDAKTVACENIEIEQETHSDVVITEVSQDNFEDLSHNDSIMNSTTPDIIDNNIPDNSDETVSNNLDIAQKRPKKFIRIAVARRQRG